MTLQIQRRGNKIFLHYKKEDIIVSLSLDMFDARNLYDFLKDMVANEGDPTIIDAIVTGAANEFVAETGRIPSAGEIVVKISRDQREKVDQATRDFLLGDNP